MESSNQSSYIPFILFTFIASLIAIVYVALDFSQSQNRNTNHYLTAIFPKNASKNKHEPVLLVSPKNGRVSILRSFHPKSKKMKTVLELPRMWTSFSDFYKPFHRQGNLLLIFRRRAKDVLAYNVKTGKELWSIPGIVGTWGLYNSHRVHHGNLFLFRRWKASRHKDRKILLEVYDITTGKKRYKIPLQGFYHQPYFTKKFMLASNGKKLLLLSIADGRFKKMSIAGPLFRKKGDFYGFRWHKQGGILLHQLVLPEGQWIPASIGGAIIYYKHINPLFGYAHYKNSFLFVEKEENQFQIKRIPFQKAEDTKKIRFPKGWRLMFPYNHWSKRERAFAPFESLQTPFMPFILKKKGITKLVMVNLKTMQRVWTSSTFSRKQAEFHIQKFFSFKNRFYMHIGWEQSDALLILDRSTGAIKELLQIEFPIGDKHFRTYPFTGFSPYLLHGNEWLGFWAGTLWKWDVEKMKILFSNSKKPLRLLSKKTELLRFIHRQKPNNKK